MILKSVLFCYLNKEIILFSYNQQLERSISLTISPLIDYIFGYFKKLKKKEISNFN